MQEPQEPTQSRAERSRARSSRRRKFAALGAVGVLAAAALGVGGWLAAKHAWGGSTAGAAGVAHTAPASIATVSSQATPSGATAASRVEVPDLTSLSVDQAATILRGAGLGMQVSIEGTAATPADVVVLSQLPVAGTVASTGTVVAIVVPAQPRKVAGAKPARRVSRRFVIVIDPGHQSRADDALEPIGPGSAEKKPRVTAGVTGVVSGMPEYEVDLELSTNLKNRLEAAGVRVVMTRTTNDVDVSNAERAQIANAAKADLFVRVHVDSSPDQTMAGVSTLFPVSNRWTKPFVSPSHRAAAVIERRLVSTTGAENRGSTARPDIAGFNWARVPSVLIQAGYQSNPVEDRLLASAHYQDLVAQGMADGVLAYLHGRR